MSTKNRTELKESPKTEAAEERAHTEGHPAGAKEALPMGRRERMPSDGHTMSNHNSKGEPNRRGKNLAYATRKFKK
jgi:hypothetical protein